MRNLALMEESYVALLHSKVGYGKDASQLQAENDVRQKLNHPEYPRPLLYLQCLFRARARANRL